MRKKIEKEEAVVEAPIVSEAEELQEIESTEQAAQVVEPLADESAEKKAFRIFVENYKVSNPVKYEMKKEAFEEQLDSMK